MKWNNKKAQKKGEEKRPKTRLHLSIFTPSRIRSNRNKSGLSSYNFLSIS